MTHQIRSPSNPELTTLLNHAWYVAAWPCVTPNSSRMTGLFAFACEVAWSAIHWDPQAALLGFALWPQPSGYNYRIR